MACAQDTYTMAFSEFESLPHSMFVLCSDLYFEKLCPDTFIALYFCTKNLDSNKSRFFNAHLLNLCVMT